MLELICLHRDLAQRVMHSHESKVGKQAMESAILMRLYCSVMQAVTMSPIMGIISGFIRMVFPIAAAFYLIKFTFRLGATQKRDK